MACLHYWKLPNSGGHSPVQSLICFSWAAFLSRFRLTLLKPLARRVHGLKPCIIRETVSNFCVRLFSFASGWAPGIATTVALPSTRNLSILGLRRLDNYSAAQCFTPSRWTTSRSSSDSRSLHLARFPVTSDLFNIHRSASGSVRIAIQDPLKYGLRSRTSDTTVRNLLCVLSYACSAIVHDHKQSLVIQAAPAIWRTPLARHRYICRAYVARLILVVTVTAVTAVDAVELPAPLF